MRAVLVAVAAAALLACACGEENGLALTPPLTWSSWYALGCDGLNEDAVRANADVLSAKLLDGGTASLVDRGYRVMVLDDCWMAYTRDANGDMQPDPDKFPSGMPALTQYLNARGIDLGLYTTPGNYTCEKRAATGGHEARDAKQFVVNWGARYVKYCVCNTTHEWRMRAYNIFSDAVNQTGIPTLLECDPFMEDPWTWMGPICNLWAAHNDIDNSFKAWNSALLELEERGVAKFAGPGQWNLPDMLSIGVDRARHVRTRDVGPPRARGVDAVQQQTQTEYRSQMIMYALVAAPLVIGTDLRTASGDTLELYGATEVLKVSQDPVGIQGRLLRMDGFGQIWAKPLETAGSYAVALLNGDSMHAITLSFSYFQVCTFHYNNVSKTCVPYASGSPSVVITELLSSDPKSQPWDATADQVLSFVVEPRDTVFLLLENSEFEASSDYADRFIEHQALIFGSAALFVVAAVAVSCILLRRKRALTTEELLEALEGKDGDDSEDDERDGHD